MKNVHCLDSRLGHRLPKHMIQEASSTDIFGVFDSNLKACFREGNASNDQEIWLNMKELGDVFLWFSALLHRWLDWNSRSLTYIDAGIRTMFERKYLFQGSSFHSEFQPNRSLNRVNESIAYRNILTPRIWNLLKLWGLFFRFWRWEGWESLLNRNSNSKLFTFPGWNSAGKEWKVGDFCYCPSTRCQPTKSRTMRWNVMPMWITLIPIKKWQPRKTKQCHLKKGPVLLFFRGLLSIFGGE